MLLTSLNFSTTLLLRRFFIHFIDWADYEVEESITTLRELLQKNFRVMTSFERYEKELRNGQLMFGKKKNCFFYLC